MYWFVASPYLKYVLLIILVIQNAVLILSMRYSRLVEGGCVCLSVCVYVCVCFSVCLSVSLSVGVCLCMCVCVCTCVYMCVYVYMCVLLICLNSFQKFSLCNIHIPCLNRSPDIYSYKWVGVYTSLFYILHRCLFTL